MGLFWGIYVHDFLLSTYFINNPRNLFLGKIPCPSLRIHTDTHFENPGYPAMSYPNGPAGQSPPPKGESGTLFSMYFKGGFLQV